MKGVYIHIPYCVSKCAYCSFCSYPRDNFREYADAVIKEIELRSGGKNELIDTIYFGGGTPTVFPTELTAEILAAVRKFYRVSPNAEITTECNPNSASKEKIGELTALGFNRFSVGLQCADDKILAAIGRPHNTDDFCRTVTAIQSYGAAVSADIMLGLPNQTIKIVENTLDLLEKFDIPHVSAYALKLERGTPLYKAWRSGKITLPDDDSAAETYDFVKERLAKRGVFRYEISNFARIGYECKHNLVYWRLGEYVGIGASAHGFEKGIRYSNVKNLDKYIDKLSRGNLPTVFCQKQTLDDNAFDFVMLGLRLDSGISLGEFERRFGENLFIKYKNAEKLIKKGVLTRDGDRLFVNEKFFYVLNDVLVDLLFD